MFPLHDSIQSRTTPWVTYTIILLNSIAFLFQLSIGPENQLFIEDWGMVPAKITAHSSLSSELSSDRPRIQRSTTDDDRLTQPIIVQPLHIPSWVTMLTCLFLHGGIMHFAGNMWFLHIFGDNVEDRFGHVAYVFVYLASGLFAGVTHILSDPASTIPTIGASGAIAGVMGAYTLLYPKSVVQTLIPLPMFLTTISVPAPFFLVLWFAIQVYSGASTQASGGGVAWWAHVGGFATGAVAALFIILTRLGSPPSINERQGYSFSREPN